VKSRVPGEGMRLMISLVSPKYNFLDFCQCMFGKDPLQVIDAASAEITYARLIHQEKTKDRNFRRGSRGRAYCNDLQQLISLFMGSAPDKVSPEFIDAVSPLARHLRQKWEILELTQILGRMSEAKAKTTSESLPPADLVEAAPFIHIVARRSEVENCMIEPTLTALEFLNNDPEEAVRYKNNVTLSFQGYDEDPRALFQIEEVRQFVEELNAKWYSWFFFMTKDASISPLAVITLCLCQYKRSRAGRFRPVAADAKGLYKYHFTALRFVCKTCNLSDEQTESAVQEVIDYFMRVDFVSGCDTPQLALDSTKTGTILRYMEDRNRL
jgi:hypothetical protein